MIKKKFAFLAICLFFIAIITSACGGGKTTPPDNSAYYYYLLAQQNANNNEQEQQNEAISVKYPLELSQTDFTLNVGATDNITVTLNGEDITETATYTVDQEAIVTVEQGLITGLSVGVATVTVHSDNAEADKTFTVNVINPTLPTLEVSKSELSLAVGCSEDITVTLEGKVVTEDVKYDVEEPEVAKVEKDTVTALSKGTTRVTVSLDGANNAVFTVEIIGVGDYIKFGRYRQTGDGDNVEEWEPQPIEWQILSIDPDNNRVLVVSHYGLDASLFDDDSNVWADSEIRRWLNEDFYNTAFDETETAKIKPVDIVFKEDGSDYYDYSGSTYNVFLLSEEEAEKYFANDEARKCKSTDYAVNNNVSVSGNGYSLWWLRSYKSMINSSAYCVLDDGSILGFVAINDMYYAVRPALWINL